MAAGLFTRVTVLCVIIAQFFLVNAAPVASDAVVARTPDDPCSGGLTEECLSEFGWGILGDGDGEMVKMPVE
ncbi:hypothetical protein BKA93DRAFT_827195 [Sparassis latifolia]